MPYRQHKKVREEISRAFLQYTFVMGRNVTTVAQLHKFSITEKILLLVNRIAYK